MKNLLWVILLILLCPVAQGPSLTIGYGGQGQESAENKEKIEAKKPVLERSEGTEGPSQEQENKEEAKEQKETGRSDASLGTAGETKREFLRLAEPKAKKAAPPKRSPWGGYWGAIYGEKSLEEEGAGPTKEESNPPKADIDVPPPTLSEYMEVDFGKLASGSYAIEYENKYLKVRCRFLSLAPEGTRIKDYQPPGYINFIVGGPGTGMASLTVVAKREKADKVFGLESQKEVVIYGKALRLGLSGLTLMIEEIEKK
ncbi:MAG: hypothetical protein Q6354_08875 [Candidatus Brocadiales bacterium]|nr:hypothetical protein [Candidatus Brocadiales bacterium]